MSSFTISRRNLIIRVPALSLALGLGAGSLNLAFAQEATPAAIIASEWGLYGADLSGSRSITSALDSSTVTGLNLVWTVAIGGPISATPCGPRTSRHPQHRRPRSPTISFSMLDWTAFSTPLG